MTETYDLLKRHTVKDCAFARPLLVDIFERHFGLVELAPNWLWRPLEALEAAARQNRGPAERLDDLAQMVAQLDGVFVTHQADWAEPSALVDVAEKISPRSVAAWTETLLDYAAILIESQIWPDLLQRGFRILEVGQLEERQRIWLHDHFMQRIYPLLTPLAVDPGRPFPYISNDSLNLLVELQKRDVAAHESAIMLARIKVPRATPRLIALPGRSGGQRSTPCDSAEPNTYVWSGDVVRFFINDMFTGIPVDAVFYFRVLRSAETSLTQLIQNGTGRMVRQSESPVVRVDVDCKIPDSMLDWLVDHLGAPPANVIRCARPLDLMCLSHLSSYVSENVCSDDQVQASVADDSV